MKSWWYLVAMEALLLWGAAMGILIGYGLWGRS